MSDHDTKVLKTLIATTIDSAKGYEYAAERASDDRLKPIFEQFARERRQTADRLKDQVRQFGGTPEDSGTLKAAAHRRWLDLKDALGKGDRAVLNSVQADSSLLGGMPTWLQSLLIVVAPTGGAYLVGWSTKHTPRNNEDASRGTV